MNTNILAVLGKSGFLTVCGIVGGAIATALGGWDESVVTLLICMGIDYITGMIVAGVYHESKKSESGKLDSHAAFKGILKKIMMLAIVAVSYRLDLMLEINYVRNAVVIAFVVNEILSILENAGLMGITYPKALSNALEVLQNKTEQE